MKNTYRLYESLSIENKARAQGAAAMVVVYIAFNVIASIL